LISIEKVDPHVRSRLDAVSFLDIDTDRWPVLTAVKLSVAQATTTCHYFEAEHQPAWLTNQLDETGPTESTKPA
jgi:hypothetical protein